LTQLTIDGDKKGNGRLEGDVFFDIAQTNAFAMPQTRSAKEPVSEPKRGTAGHAARGGRRSSLQLPARDQRGTEAEGRPPLEPPSRAVRG
jgi:hypothetical protein